MPPRPSQKSPLCQVEGAGPISEGHHFEERGGDSRTCRDRSASNVCGGWLGVDSGTFEQTYRKKTDGSDASALFHTLAPPGARRFRYCFPRTILCGKRRSAWGKANASTVDTVQPLFGTTMNHSRLLWPALFASLLAASSALYYNDVTSNDFDKLIDSSKASILLEFYAPWCGHVSFQLSPFNDHPSIHLYQHSKPIGLTTRLHPCTGIHHTVSEPRSRVRTARSNFRALERCHHCSGRRRQAQGPRPAFRR